MSATAALFAGRLPAILATGFLLGSLPFSVWAGRSLAGVDVRQTGSRNPGASNVWRSVGRLTGAAVGLADAAKGAAAVWIAWAAGLPDGVAVWAGVAAVVGHDFSPFLRFRGGKGGATTLGALACFILPELVAVAAIWIASRILDPPRRFVWSIAAVSASPLLATLPGRAPVPWLSELPPRPLPVVIAAAVLSALLWARVLPGLRQRRA